MKAGIQINPHGIAVAHGLSGYAGLFHWIPYQALNDGGGRAIERQPPPGCLRI